MKIKIINFVPKNIIGSLTDLFPKQILNLDEEVAMKLIEKGYAEIEI